MLYFFNNLFDSFNGIQGQGLSSIISPNSGHTQLWQQACKKLSNMQYVDKQTRKVVKKNAPKCLKNWIWTIKAAQNIWNILHKNNFDSLNLRFLNQDVLENFFSQIRSNGCANTNPSPVQFQGAFKSLLICNFTSKHSIGANCRENNEGTTFALSQLMDLSERMKEIYSKEVHEVECTEAAIPAVAETEIVLDAEKIINYVCRNKTIAQCEKCDLDLENGNIVHFVQDATDIMEKTFPNICYESKLSEKLAHVLEDKYLTYFSEQCTHLKVLLQIIAVEFIQISCTFINNILSRKTEIHSDNFLYNTAKRLSTKYVKKRSESKTDKRQQIIPI